MVNRFPRRIGAGKETPFPPPAAETEIVILAQSGASPGPGFRFWFFRFQGGRIIGPASSAGWRPDRAGPVMVGRAGGFTAPGRAAVLCLRKIKVKFDN